MNIKNYKLKNTYSGQILFIFAASFVTLMMIVMLLIDFGGAAIFYHRAQIATDSAAYAAAQSIDMVRFKKDNRVVLDAAVAAAVAGQVASQNSVGKLSLVRVYVDTDRVYVTGEMTYKTMFAGYIGIPSIRAHIESSAIPSFGLQRVGQ